MKALLCNLAEYCGSQQCTGDVTWAGIFFKGREETDRCYI
ncbi:MAG: hypothetical protein RHS_3046 [Robinsoniella sp. RHS]|nr:MAG: hypothetical protein RHS_3046 [Robinsoniella sp. RHS]